LDQEEYQKRYDSLVERFDATKANLELTTEQIKDKITRHKNLEIFLYELRNQEDLITEFNPLLWNSLVKHITVYEKDKTQVAFKNGIEL
ncbi:MAG: recombinase family protein, partial [Bacteroidales bacterium]|nr:recombinase family protein [Bacteroidales bacterium]